MISQADPSNGDSQLIDRVIAEFLQAEAEGKAGNPQVWLDRYPACAAELAEFLEDRARVDNIVRVDYHATPGGHDRTDVFTPINRRDAAPTVDLRPEPPKLASTRYKPLSFHARGGMGEIWLAKDERIGRHVAIKKLRPGSQTQQPRFFVEAQVTGQLEHPSVVPLHDLGLDDAGQPYYVMKFIHGRRLKEAIAQFHSRKSATNWPADLEFRRLLEILINVCNVVAYAHHKGVIHRDIKPDNVMLGAYGEVLVVDWGLAKVVGQPDEERGSIVRLSGSGSTATQDGAIVGSPYYMSPEGAEGRPEAVDQASDVYLLGATLYEMLCGLPPRQASSNWELIDLALHSRPTNPRKVDAQVPRALEAICQKAMSFKKQDRYATPLALADDLERYLAGAPTAAYREPYWTRAQRWLRRHRRGLLQAAAALCLLISAAFAIDRSQRARVLAEREKARQTFADFQRLTDEAYFFAANTDAISERAPYFDPHRAEMAGQAALALAAPWGERAAQFPLADQRAELLQSEYGLLLEMAQIGLLGTPSENELRNSLALLDRAGKLQSPSREYHLLRAQCFALLGESDAARLERERADDPATVAAARDYFLAGERLRMQDLGQIVRVFVGDAAPGNTLARREHLSAAIDQYRQVLALDPRHYWARFQLGRCLMILGRGPEAVETFSTCVALRPSSPWAFSARGLANAFSGRRTDALADLDNAVRLDPDFQPARLWRGVVHCWNNDNEKALADFDFLMQSPDDKRLFEAAFHRGQIYLNEKRQRDAIADFSAVLAARPDCAAAAWFRAKARFELGDFDAGLLDLKESLAAARKETSIGSVADGHLALGIALRSIAQQMTGDARRPPLRAATEELKLAIDAGPPTAEMWQQLGAIHELLGQNAEAIQAYGKGLVLDSNNVALHNMRAWARIKEKQYDAAKDDFDATLRVAPKNAEAHAGLGFVLAQFKRDEDARYEASAAILAGADNHLILHNVACIFARLSSAQGARKTELEDLAIAALSRAVSLSRQNPLSPDADEIALIRRETAFPRSLRSRPEFQHLLDENSLPDQNESTN